MATHLDEYRAYRTCINARIDETDHLSMKRFFNLDSAAYRDGLLDSKTKDLLGLVVSTLLRCNECIDYHLIQCFSAG